MIQTSDSSRIYVGNNSTSVPYPVPFKFHFDEDLVVVVKDETGMEDAQLLGTDYTVLGAGAPDGGSITTTWAVPATSHVSIARIVPMTQLTSYEEGDSFPAKSHEKALDKLTMEVQQLARGMGTGEGDADDLGTAFRLTEASGGIRSLPKINNTTVGLDASGQAVLRSPTELLQNLGVVASTWPDASARLTAAAIYKGQIGVQLSDLSIWVANSTAPGDWLPHPRANGVVIANNGVTTAKPNPDGDIVGTTAAQVLTNKTLNAPTINNPLGMVPADVGLGNIDDTSDASKPISDATQLALETKEDKAAKGIINGYPPLDIAGKIPPEFLPGGGTGGTVFKGTWNASTNIPAIPAAAAGNLGWFYTVSVAGTTTVDGISSWAIGDNIYSNGTVWQKVPATGSAVVSVAGRTGVVVLAKTDVGLANVDNTSDATKNAATATLTNKTISGASNTLNVRLNTSDVSGNLPPARLNNGTGAAANTWWCGDGTWKQPQGTGDVNGPADSSPDTIPVFDGATGKALKRWEYGSGFVRVSALGVPVPQDKIKIGDLDNEDWVNVPEMMLVTEDDELLVWDSDTHALMRVKRKNTGVPVGTIIDWGGLEAALPVGWLLCDGHLVSKATYAALYAVIGDQFKWVTAVPADQFKLPDLRGVALAGSDKMGGTDANRLDQARTFSGYGDGNTVGSYLGACYHQMTVAEMPQHAHSGYNRHTHLAYFQTLIGASGFQAGAHYNVTGAWNGTTEVAGVSDYGYQGSNALHNNVQPTVITNKLIKY